MKTKMTEKLKRTILTGVVLIVGVVVWGVPVCEAWAQEGLAENEEAELEELAREEMKAILRDLEADIMMEQFRDLRMEAFHLEKELRLIRVDLEAVREEGEKDDLERELELLERKLTVIEDWSERIRADLLESASAR
jgi:hypothetical protein